MLRILVIRACAIGDFVLNLPALIALHHLYKDGRFTLVGYPSTMELASAFVPVEAIHSIETGPWSQLFYKPLLGLRFDSAKVWMKDPVFADNLRASGVPDVSRMDPFPTYGHAATHLLRTLGLPEPPLPDLWEPASDHIIVHASSGSAKKNWPHFEELKTRLGATARELPKDLPLVDLARYLRRCRAYIGNDSGITHLAAYLGCPTIALFGPTDPRIWGPIGRRSRIVWKTNLEDISVDEILQALMSF